MQPRYWQVFWGEADYGTLGCLMVVGPTEYAVPVFEEFILDLVTFKWVATMDHEPSEDEKSALTPGEFVS